MNIFILLVMLVSSTGEKTVLMSDPITMAQCTELMSEVTRKGFQAKCVTLPHGAVK